MSTDLVHLTLDLYEFVHRSEGLTRLRARRSLLDSLRPASAELYRRFQEASRAAAADLRTHAASVTAELEALTSELARRRPRAAELRERWTALATVYEAMHLEVRRRRVALPEGRELAHLKPRNYHRNLFHVANGVVGVVVYELLGSQAAVTAIAAGILFLFIGMDLLRRSSKTVNDRFMNQFFARIARPHEAHRIPSAVWFVGGLLVGVIWLPQTAIELGALALAFGDPAASLSGRRFGRTRLRGQKTLEGTIGFVGATFIVALVALALLHPSLGLGHRTAIAAAVALAGAGAELFSGRLDDNLVVPLAAGLAAALVL